MLRTILCALLSPVLLSFTASACSSNGSTAPGGSEAAGSGGGGGVASGSGGGAGGAENLAARPLFVDDVQPRLAERCGACHLGKRFAFGSLERAGKAFTEEETERNYRTFLNLISLDSPAQSRLLAKMLGGDDEEGMPHAGGAVADRSDALFKAAETWIREEKRARCADCGTTATVEYLAYVEAPAIFWALAPDPIRVDHGLRDRARIKIRKLDPKTGEPGDAVDFLGDGFCGKDGRCDFGHLAVDYAGKRMAFECRLSLEPADWVTDVRWNICIAEIGADGRAKNPRFLLPSAERMKKTSVARSDPFGLEKDGDALVGVYDLHFQTRRGADTGPAFSPDDQRVYFSSMGPDPRTGTIGTQTYHGFELLNNIVAVDIDGGDRRTIYVNEGGVADVPFFLRNGNVAFHTWNLERMDRHLYTQSMADGMGELPVLFGRVQGPNMWGRAVQLANGGILGMTGRRRSAIDNYVPFFADHTLGLGFEQELPSHTILDLEAFEQIEDFPGGYCESPPDGPNCRVDRFYADPTYAPDGGVYLAHNPETTYVLRGEEMFINYASGSNLDESLASLAPYVPNRMGISKMDARGGIERVLEPEPGMMNTHPVWVGKRHRPVAQPWKSDEAKKTADLHIANVPLWFSFARTDGIGKASVMQVLDGIVGIRVLEKVLDGNYCMNDGRPYRYAVNDGVYDHPTHLGKNNSTGYLRLAVSEADGGDAFGDVPLRADGSVKLRLPAGKLLLFQGIDAKGRAVVQRSRLLATPPGSTVDASVRADQYASQCMSCHGSLDTGATYAGLADTDKVPLVELDFTTDASKRAPARADQATLRPAYFLGAIRPLLDAHCVNCHSGGSPAGELSLEKKYSPSGNYPAGKWATTPGLSDAAYLSFVPVGKRVSAYNYSVSYAWNFREDNASYKSNAAYAAAVADHQPLGDLAPWDPAYQNLFAVEQSSFRYLGGPNDSNFGRSDRLGGMSRQSWLLEILTGEDLDPVRSFGGIDHTGFLSNAQVREIMAVIDVGFPYMARCDERKVPSGPNAGKPWGDPTPH